MKTYSTIILVASLLSANAALAETSSTDVPDFAPLEDLAVDTSVFLLHDFQLPPDSAVEQVKLEKGFRRVDYFVEGKRVPRSEIPSGSTYCSIVSGGDTKAFTETSKQFQILGVTEAIPAAREGERGVGLKLRSFQNSTIQAVSCYQSTQASLPLTVRVLRYMVRAVSDDVSLSLMAPIEPNRSPAQLQFVNYVKPATPNETQGQ